MRHLGLLLGGILLFVATATAETPNGIQAYAWLAGEWRGIGDGKPGHSAAERRIDVVLGGRYLRVVGRSVYPKQDDNPRGEIQSWTLLFRRHRQFVAFVGKVRPA
jgi:hypothetical protein